MINFKFKTLAISAYTYMVLPILIFFITWLKWYIGIPMTIILCFGLFRIIKENYLYDEDYFSMSYSNFCIILIVLGVFLFLTGQGGFFFQYNDNHWRNAIFRDLITFDWPVIYPKTGNALVYYILHWILPAFIAKLFNPIGIGFEAGRILLFIWTYIGFLISFLIICNYLKINKKKVLWLILIIFIGWNGINIIPGIISYMFSFIDWGDVAIGWWTNFKVNGQPFSYMYRSNFDQLASTYNQTIVPWIATPLVLSRPKVGTFAFLGLCVLPYAPLPFLGLFIIMIVLGGQYCYKVCLKEKRFVLMIKVIIKEILTIPNITAIFSIFIVFLFYFKSNVAFSTGASGNAFGLYVPLSEYTILRIIVLIEFYIFHFGIFAYLIKNDYKKNILFWTVIISLILMPIFRIGTMGDFCWNASVSANFILMIFVMKYMVKRLDNVRIINNNIIVLIMCLTLGILHPLSQIAFSSKFVIKEKRFNLIADNIKSFSNLNLDSDIEYLSNFLLPNPEKSIFYKYFAK